MTLYEYPETAPDNLLEKLLDLELTARRHLTIGAAAGLDRL